MTYIVTEPCINCKHSDCVGVCPVDCFREGPNFLVIDPELCIDCGVCIPACPVKAIYAEPDVPENQKHFIQINLDLSKLWPEISKQIEPMPEADKYKDIKDKLGLLIR